MDATILRMADQLSSHILPCILAGNDGQTGGGITTMDGIGETVNHA